MILKPLTIASLALMTVSGLTLTACDPAQFQSEVLNIDQKVDVQQRSYEAADVLVRQASNALSLDTPIIVGTLSDINRFENSTPLGRLIPEQVGTRLAQLGYNVQEVKLRKSINVNNDLGTSGEFLTSRDPEDISSEQQAGAVVTGTYTIATKNVMINLRMVDTQTRRVLGAYDYTMPVNSDIRQMSKAETGQGVFFETTE